MPSGTSSAELRALSERIRQGDASAETELVRQFSHRIFIMGLVRTRDRETSRELVQDVLIAVLCALRKGQLLDPDKLAAFVHGTARNLINNQFRNQTQRPQLESLPEDLVQDSFADQFEEVERVSLVRKALERLGQQDRKILLMTLVEGHKPAEIAAALELTPEVVRTRKLRAVRKVADLIKKGVTKPDRFTT